MADRDYARAALNCDGCGYVLRIGAHGPPPAWFLDGKAPPRWRKVQRTPNGGRIDYCPKCKAGSDKGGDDV